MVPEPPPACNSLGTHVARQTRVRPFLTLFRVDPSPSSSSALDNTPAPARGRLPNESRRISTSGDAPPTWHTPTRSRDSLSSCLEEACGDRRTVARRHDSSDGRVDERRGGAVS